MLGLIVAGAVFATTAGLGSAQQGPPAGPGTAGQNDQNGRGGPPPTPPTAGMNLTLAEGSASYRVTEQFVGIDYPNDAIGTSTAVTGNIGIDKDGGVVPGSKLTVDLRELKSDQDMRDGYIKRNTFQTDQYPYAEFVPTKVTGVPLMIPTQGQTGFMLTGNMTIHGVTKEITFQGIATFGRDSTVAGRAKTSFTFDTFGLTQPKIGRLASVDNKIDLSIEFKFKRS